jgi:hypothetical protein
VATGFATVVPNTSNWPLAARVATVIATLVIAMLRSLDFGARWRWQLHMRAAYLQLLDQLAVATTLTTQDRRAEVQKVAAALTELRGRESAIPGTGATASDRSNA